MFSDLALSAALLNYQIYHVPPAHIEPGQPLTIVADISPAAQVSIAVINWRRIGDTEFRRNRMPLVDPSRDRFSATFPASWLSRPGLEYYISIIDRRQEHHILFKDAQYPQQVWFIDEKPLVPELRSELLEEFALVAAEDVIFAAAKHEQKISEAPSAVSVISREEIRASGLKSLPEVLRMAPGIEVYEITPGYPVVGCRGFTDDANNLMVVLLDGREVNSPLFGSTFYASLPVAVEEIERIEIIRGPGSSLYGANAFSGVINIITQAEKADDRVFSVNGGWQSHLNQPYLGGFARAGGNLGEKFHYYLATGYREEDFWSKRPGEALQVGFARAQLLQKLFEENQVIVQAEGGISLGNWDYFFPLSPVGIAGDEYFARIGVRGYGASFQGYLNQSAVDLDFLDPALSEMLGNSRVPLLTNLIDLSGQFDHDFGRWSRLILGGNFRVNQFRSSRFHDPLTGDTQAQEKNYGLFFQDEVRLLEYLLLTLGLRYDASDTIKERTPSPRVSLIVLPHPNHSVRLGFAQAFRKPQYQEYGMRISEFEKEKVIISQVVVRNFTEKVQSLELGYSGRLKPEVKVGVDCYFNRYRDLIDFSYKDNQYFNWEQKSRVDSYGGEIWGNYRLGSYLSLAANYSFNQIVSNWENPQLGIRKGVRLTFSPQHKANAAVLVNYKSLRFRSALHYYSSRLISEFRDPVNNVLPASGSVPQEVDAFMVLNLRLSLLLIKDKLEVGFTGQNLLTLFGGRVRQFPGDYWLTERTTDFGGERVGAVLLGTFEFRF